MKHNALFCGMLSGMKSQCATCLGEFDSYSGNHVYCSKACRTAGGIDFQRTKRVPDVLAFINHLAFQTGAAAMRLGVRRKQSIIRYFPADGAKTPLAELPPLPDAGCYLIQFFDKVGEPLLLEQTVIEIPSSMIKRSCRFGEGSRTRKLYP